MPTYDDSDGEEDYNGSLHLLKPMMKSVKTNLYDDFDPDGENDNLGTGRSATASNKSRVTDQSASGVSSHRGTMSSTGSTSGNIGYDADGSTINDWKEVPYQPRTFASGFLNRHYKSVSDATNPRKFARIRPMNLRLDEIDENVLDKNHEAPKYNGRRKRGGGYGSDDEW